MVITIQSKQQTLQQEGHKKVKILWDWRSNLSSLICRLINPGKTALSNEPGLLSWECTSKAPKIFPPFPELCFLSKLFSTRSLACGEECCDMCCSWLELAMLNSSSDLSRLVLEIKTSLHQDFLSLTWVICLVMPHIEE